MHYWGGCGVVIFFQISAFFMARNKIGSFSHYIKRKVLRLYPSYFAAIIIIYLVTHLMILPNRTVGLEDLFFNLIGIAYYFDFPLVDGAHWFLFVLIPVIIIIGLFYKLNLYNKFQTYIIWMILQGALLKFTTINLTKCLGYTYTGIFASGIAVYNIINSANKEKIKWYITFVISLIFTLYFLKLDGVIELSISSFLLIISVLGYVRLFEAKVLVFFGSISYSLFLVHQNISYSIIYSLTNRYSTYRLWYGILAICASILLALFITKVSNYFVSKINNAGLAYDNNISIGKGANLSKSFKIRKLGGR